MSLAYDPSVKFAAWAIRLYTHKFSAPPRMPDGSNPTSRGLSETGSVITQLNSLPGQGGVIWARIPARIRTPPVYR
jgi:hypothetical protein